MRWNSRYIHVLLWTVLTDHLALCSQFDVSNCNGVQVLLYADWGSEPTYGLGIWVSTSGQRRWKCHIALAVLGGNANIRRFAWRRASQACQALLEIVLTNVYEVPEREIDDSRSCGSMSQKMSNLANRRWTMHHAKQEQNRRVSFQMSAGKTMLQQDDPSLQKKSDCFYNATFYDHNWSSASFTCNVWKFWPNTRLWPHRFGYTAKNV